jgi:hypothetical protein
VIDRAFAEYLESRGVATLFSDLFVSQLPAKTASSDGQWAVIIDGGPQPTGGNVLLWRQTVSLRVRFRHRDRSVMETANADLRAAVKALRRLSTGPVFQATVTPMSDTDTDSEGRHTASWTVSIDTTT